MANELLAKGLGNDTRFRRSADELIQELFDDSKGGQAYNAPARSPYIAKR